MWDGGEERDWSVSRTSESQGIDTYMTDNSNFGYRFWQNVDMNLGYTESRVSWDKTDDIYCEYRVKIWFTTSYVETRYDCDVTIWSTEWRINQRSNEWNPYALEDEASRLFLLSQFENQDEESSNTTLIAASAAAGFGLVLAGFALKRK